MFKSSLGLFLLSLFTYCVSSTTIDLKTHANELKELWNAWKNLNDKFYSESEEDKRFNIFVENYIKIVTHNREESDIQLAVNQFADLTEEEFAAKYTGGLMIDEDALDREEAQENAPHVDFSVLNYPESVDWRKEGGVTPPRDQGDCGSCWAFSAVETLEGLNYIMTGKLTPLSVQQLVDCDRKKNNGCNGGWPSDALTYTAEAGIQYEQDYPYTATNVTCQYNAEKTIKVNSGFDNVPKNNPNALKAALVQQPVSIAMTAVFWKLMFYKGGVLKNYCFGRLNHAVLAVGYGQIKGEDAFIVKNSWGPKWGDNGYLYISTNKEANGGAGVCKILKKATYPLPYLKPERE